MRGKKPDVLCAAWRAQLPTEEAPWEGGAAAAAGCARLASLAVSEAGWVCVPVLLFLHACPLATPTGVYARGSSAIAPTKTSLQV